MKNIDELLKRAQKTYDGWNNPPSPELPGGAGIVLELATALCAQQAEIERLKGEYAQFIKNVIVIAGGAPFSRGYDTVGKIRALLPNQKEGE